MDNIEKFKKNKIIALDTAFEETYKKNGYYEAKLALKYVLLGDTNGENINTEIDKYLYISSKNSARELIKLIDNIDLIQILAKFAMQKFGVLNKNFEITEDEYKNIRSKKNINLDNDKLIEFIAYATYKDYLEGYYILTKNKLYQNKLLDLLIDYRYKKNLKSELDNYDGLLAGNKEYREKYSNLDKSYIEIRNACGII